MIYGFLIAFFIALVLGISIALVIAIVLREVSDHIYEGGSFNTPDQDFRTHLQRVRDSKVQGGKVRRTSRHRHYNA